MKKRRNTGPTIRPRQAKSIGILITLIATLCFTAVNEPLFAAERKHTITIGGTGCALAGVKLVAGAFQKKNPDIAVTIVPSLGSGGGIKAALAGAIDVALSARPLNESERTQGAHAAVYARTPFVFATAGAGKNLSLSLRQVASIYSGEMRTWPDGRTLRLVMRPPTDTDMAILKQMSPDMDNAVGHAQSRDGLLSAVTDQENAELLSKVSGAFGAVTLAQILSENRPLKPIALDGVIPSLTTLASGAYPFAKTFYAVTGPQRSSEVRRFLDFLLSPAGGAILGRNGHLSVAREP